MGKYPTNQSAFGRAISDTVMSQRSAKFMWGGEGVLAVAGGAWLVQIAPIGVTTAEIIIRSIVGGLGGLVTAFVIVLAWNLLRAPYKQRNEARAALSQRPKPIPLPNRNELLRAISEVKQTSGRVLMEQEQMDKWQATHPDNVPGFVIERATNAITEYGQAMSNLYSEKMVAGNPFESILNDLDGYISTQVWIKLDKLSIVGGEPDNVQVRSAVEIVGRIAGRINGAIREINEITGQVRDKEGSQPE